MLKSNKNSNIQKKNDEGVFQRYQNLNSADNLMSNLKDKQQGQQNKPQFNKNKFIFEPNNNDNFQSKLKMNDFGKFMQEMNKKESDKNLGVKGLSNINSVGLSNSSNQISGQQKILGSPLSFQPLIKKNNFNNSQNKNFK